MQTTTPSPTCPVDCGCHGGPGKPCTVPGGCGSEGCQRRRRGSCPACGRRDPEPEDGRVCGPCQRWLPVGIRSIVDKTAQLPELIEPADQNLDDRWYWHWHPLRKDPETGGLLPPEGEWRRSEPLTAIGGAGPVSGQRKDPRVSGSREAPAPLPLDVLDLLGPVVRDGGIPVDSISDTKRPATVPGPETKLQVRHLRMQPIRDEDTNRIIDEQLVEEIRTIVVRPQQPVYVAGKVVYRAAGDQIGHVPVAAALDQEVRAWIDAGAPGAQWRPVPTVDRLAEWLIRRLPWACEHYEPIGDFVAAIRHLRGVLMAVLDEFDPEPEPCVGVECNRCDQRLLFRRNDGTGDVDCMSPSCRKVFRADEYQEWVKHLGAYEAFQRTPAEVAQLLRPTYQRPDEAA